MLTNAAKLTIGDDANRYGSFSGQVTGDAGSQLHLYTKKVHDGYWGEDGTVQLRQGSTVQDVYIHGDLALNIIAGSQGSLGDKFTNVQGANLHMDAGSQLVVRAEEGTGITPTTGNIVLGGDLSIVTYSSLTTATSITSNFTKMDTGSITLSGSRCGYHYGRGWHAELDGQQHCRQCILGGFWRDASVCRRGR